MYVNNIEDDLKRSNVNFNPVRKKNSKRKYETFAEDGIKLIRKRIESVFSVITQRFPTHIHAVTAQGFELKIFLSVTISTQEYHSIFNHYLLLKVQRLEG